LNQKTRRREAGSKLRRTNCQVRRNRKQMQNAGRS
jgi:hypothetical protein